MNIVQEMMQKLSAGKSFAKGASKVLGPVSTVLTAPSELHDATLPYAGMTLGERLKQQRGGRTMTETFRDAFSQDRERQGMQPIPGAAPSDQAPTDRIKAAFDAIHQAPATTLAPLMKPGIGPELIGAPFPQTAPAAAAPALPPPMPVTPQEDPNSPIGFFMRNAMMQQEAPGAAYLDPAMAAKAQASLDATASPFKGLFA